MTYTPWVKKNMPPNFCLYLHQISTDFKNSFTDMPEFYMIFVVRSMKLRSCILTHEFFLLQELSIDQQNMSPWSQKYNVLVHNLAQLWNYRVGQKTRPLYIFANIQHYIFPNIWQTAKDNCMIFCTHQGQCIVNVPIVSEFTRFTICSGATWWIAFHLIMQH